MSNVYFDYRLEFEGAYKQQIADDIRELKYIGELDYNFEQMTTRIRGERGRQYTQQLLPLIDQLLNQDQQLYQRQEMTKKLLFNEINRLKTRCKLEIDSRKRADEEIARSLAKYEELISREVDQKRQDIKTAAKKEGKLQI